TVLAGATPFESAQNLLATRRLSKKINYEVLEKLLDTEGVKPKIEPGRSHMIPSAGPSRMYSMTGTPAAGSGYVSPSQDTAFGGSTQVNSLDRLPAALANIALTPYEATETIVYEEGDQDVESTAVNPAAAADDDDEEDDEEEEEYQDHFVYGAEDDDVGADSD
ncbi:hypothetical protein GGI21_006130, partial [Coemansia aciculifera]